MALAINGSTYGAVANDSIDDSAAINAAVKAAHAEYLKNPSAGRVTVVLPTGTLLVKGTGDKSDGAVSMLSGTALQGAGMGRTILKVADGWAGDITGVVRTPFNEVTANVGVFDLSIDGNRDATTGKIDGFYTGVRPGSTQQDSDIHVSRVEILDCSGYGFDPHEQTLRLIIENSVSHGNGLDGFVADYIVDGIYRNNIAYDSGQSGSGGMSPIMMAVMALLAQRAMSGRGSSGGGLGDLLGGGGLGGVLGGGSGGLGGGLGGLLGGSGGGLNGGILASGLGGLLDSFNRSGHGDVANSWVGTGENRPIAPNQLADALGPDTVNELSQHTGMPQQDLLSELSHVLPGVVDQLTPHGRLPQEHELDRY